MRPCISCSPSSWPSSVVGSSRRAPSRQWVSCSQSSPSACSGARSPGPSWAPAPPGSWPCRRSRSTTATSPACTRCSWRSARSRCGASCARSRPTSRASGRAPRPCWSLTTYTHPYGVVVGLIAALTVLAELLQVGERAAWRRPLWAAAAVSQGPRRSASATSCWPRASTRCRSRRGRPSPSRHLSTSPARRVRTSSASRARAA